MNAYLTVHSTSEVVLNLVSDFARGMDCSAVPSASASGRGVRINVPDADERLLELLTHVALGCIKAGLDVSEPLCEVAYQHGAHTSPVRLVLRVEDFSISAPRSNV